MKPIQIVIFILLLIGCQTAEHRSLNVVSLAQNNTENKALQDSIISEVFKSEVLKSEGCFSIEWQEELNRALQKDSTIAYLWQQKAMPLFKQGKYELGMPFLDKAVQYNEQQYLDYRAFMKCIFAKRYRGAMVDFDSAIAKFGNSYVMDHSYTFYKALCQIQLHQFEEAEVLLDEEVERQAHSQGEKWVHHLDLFYLGISRFEQNKFEEAILTFDRALVLFPEFSDVQLYKSICLRKLGRVDEANILQKLAKENGIKGFTINEDNVIYERYPYQVRWQ